jgi:hypothetical protein
MGLQKPEDYSAADMLQWPNTFSYVTIALA